MKEETHFIELPDRKIHLHRIIGDSMGPVVFCVHGAIENGRIFYSKNGKGLAYFLAAKGYDVFIIDLGGRGKSTPPISKENNYSQYDNITLELPRCLEYINGIRPAALMHWVGHSWGGVLLAALYARFGKSYPNLKSCVFLASKRQIKVFNLHKILLIDIIWKFLGMILIRVYGYLPGIKYMRGSDNESKDFYQKCTKWVTHDEWLDDDGFDYKEALSDNPLVPTLFLTGAKDYCLGHADDVNRLLAECGQQKHKFKLLSIKNGYKKDYDHINILTSKTAVEDHFNEIDDWLKVSS